MIEPPDSCPIRVSCRTAFYRTEKMKLSVVADLKDHLGSVAPVSLDWCICFLEGSEEWQHLLVYLVWLNNRNYNNVLFSSKKKQ